ncbi:sulfatase-like hydrolase/transferase [PVC group bacterium]|nr:sulfatase-like hydrolase/transferase [PVC group bacterium]
MNIAQHVPCTTLLLAVVSVGLSIPPAGADGAERARSKRPPNIVFILADDVGSEVLGSYGGTSYKTPHLDALARTGTRFTHCYSMPVCHPSRIALMTGQYPFRTQTRWGSFPNDLRTTAHVLQSAGYATAVAGKWQLVLQKTRPDHPKLLGFDESCLFGWHEGPRYHNPHIWQNGRRRTAVQKPDVFGPDVYCDFLIDFMTRNREKPFFAYFSMALCHEISDDFSPVPPPAPDGHYLTFTEMAETMDTVIGRLVAALDRLRLRERTLVLFTTDNGSPKSYLTDLTERDGKVKRLREPVISMRDGQEVRGGKGELTDRGTRVPLIANWPGGPPSGAVTDALIDFPDVLPTFAELAKARPPRDQLADGQSFAPQLRGSSGVARAFVYCGRAKSYWVRNQRWKLYNDGRLLDMDADPEEKKPIRPDDDTPDSAAARGKLQQPLDALR